MSLSSYIASLPLGKDFDSSITAVNGNDITLHRADTFRVNDKIIIWAGGGGVYSTTTHEEATVNAINDNVISLTRGSSPITLVVGNYVVKPDPFRAALVDIESRL